MDLYELLARQMQVRHIASTSRTCSQSMPFAPKSTRIQCCCCGSGRRATLGSSGKLAGATGSKRSITTSICCQASKWLQTVNVGELSCQACQAIAATCLSLRPTLFVKHTYETAHLHSLSVAMRALLFQSRKHQTCLRLLPASSSVLQYEDQLLQALALSVMPLDRLTKSAEDAAALSRTLGEQPARTAEDSLAQELLNWFKHEFFTWVRSLQLTLPGVALQACSLSCFSKRDIKRSVYHALLYVSAVDSNGVSRQHNHGW